MLWEQEEKGLENNNTDKLTKESRRTQTIYTIRGNRTEVVQEEEITRHR